MRVNVRSRGAARASRTSRSSTLLPSRSPSHGPPRVYLTTIPHIPSPIFPHFLAPSSSLGLGDLQEQAGVASRRGCRRDEGGGRGWSRRAEEGAGVRSEPRSILASPAGWTRPDIAFRSSPSRRYQATLPTSRPRTRHPPPPRSRRSALLPCFRPSAASWPANPLGEPSRFASVETAVAGAEALSARKRIFAFALRDGGGVSLLEF